MSPGVIPRLKEALPLPDLVGEYVALRKSGPDYLGLCPFHQERTPSLRVHASYFHCFGCGVSGDVIDFLARIEGISKGAAIRELSERTGIPLDGTPRTRLQRVYDREEREFSDWWWKRACEQLARRLTCMVLYDTAAAADAAGLLWRQTAGLDRQGKLALAQRCATSEERAEWRSDKRWAEVFVSALAEGKPTRNDEISTGEVSLQTGIA
jgi:hypothetical protein